MSTRSTAPIALLLAAGLVCLGASAALPAGTEVRQASPTTAVDQPVVYHVSTSTDPRMTILALVLLGLAVVAFGGAVLLVTRRIRLRRAATTTAQKSE